MLGLFRSITFHLPSTFRTCSGAQMQPCMCWWSGPCFALMPLVVAPVWPRIDCIGRQFAAVMSLVCTSGSDGPLIPDNCTSLRNVHGYMQNTHTHSHTLLPFIGILGPPTFLLGRLIVAGCVALHMRGKHNSGYFCQPFLNAPSQFLANERARACAHMQTFFKRTIKSKSSL